jgi:DNA-binding NarL/FixJ family response regulator
MLEMAEWLFAVLCNGLGQHDEVISAAREASPDEPVIVAWLAPELLEAAVRTGDHASMRSAFACVVETTTYSGTDSAKGMQARCRALMSRGEDAERLYEEAIERLRRTRLRPELARAHLLYGEWLRGENRRAQARAQLRAAHDQFTSIGMAAFAERARRELHATGERVRTRAVEARDDLTPQERQIARLARGGLSNPEIAAQLFLSPRTVEWHLRKVFTKLGIQSRRELERALPSAQPERVEP